MPNTKKPLPVVIKRYELIIGVVSLVGALAATTTSLIIQYRQAQRLDMLQVTIRNADDLRESLRKPLEGVWDFKLEFSKFFGQEAPYISTGKAIIVWRAASNDYVVYVGYGIKQQWGTEEIVTGFASGTLRANGDGWPVEPFEIPMRYDYRTGKVGFERTIGETFSLMDGTSKRDETNKQAVRLTMKFENESTVGKVIMWR
jgi:hypothetical protein